MLILGRGNPPTIFYVFQSRKLCFKGLKQLVNKNLNSGTQGKPLFYYIKYLHNKIKHYIFALNNN